MPLFGKRNQPSFDQVRTALEALGAARTLDEARRVIEAHQEALLSELADQTIAQAITFYQSQPRAVEVLENQRALLARCREVGIEAAFAGMAPDPQLTALLAQLNSLTHPAQIPQRMAVCQSALARIERTKEPGLWARLHSDLALCLAQTPTGNRPDNLEQAVSHFNQALEVYDRQTDPERWAAASLNLANCHLLITRGDRAEHVERAIELLEHMLEVATRGAYPGLWAQAQSNLGGAYTLRTRGDRADNLERAIQHCELAQELRPRESNPADWAQTQTNLGTAYVGRAKGDRAENIEHAIACFEAALEVRTRSQFPSEWGGLQQNLGMAYLERQRGDRHENARQASAYLERALEASDPRLSPDEWAEIHGKLGGVYLEMKGHETGNLERAIQHYQLQLQVHTREDYPGDWASARYNLGIACSGLRSGSRAENLERAREHLLAALEVYTREDYPEYWASIQDNLGIVYAERSSGDPADNLEQAVRYHQLALEVRTRETYPVEWARAHHNLSNACATRIRGERADNLEQAIEHCQQALTVRTRETMPFEWAMTQHSLANALMLRIQGDRIANIEQAIRHFKQALQVRTRQAVPLDWAMTASSLAAAYLERLAGNRADNLEQAIRYFEESLEVYTHEVAPVDWARTQGNLGSAYSRRLAGDAEENAEKAIEHYQAALEVYRCDRYSVDWARMHHNLGLEYRKRPRGQGAENVARAAEHYRQALEVHTREAMPAQCMGTLRALGHLYFEQGDWSAALACYDDALQIGQNLLTQAYTETGRQSEVAAAAQSIAAAAYCLLKLGKHAEALLRLEQGKTRLLVEALALADADLGGLPDEQHLALKRARQAVRDLESRLRLAAGTPSDSVRQVVDQLRQARLELSRVVEAIRASQPEFMPGGLTLAGILELAPPGGALIAPLITPHGSAVFVIPHGEKEVSERHVIWLDDFAYSDLAALLVGGKEGPGWLSSYMDFRALGTPAALAAWKSSIDRITGRLWDVLVAPIQPALKELAVRQLILLPQGGLQLLPLHAAWQPAGDRRRYLLDEYEIGYAPSAYALDLCRRRAGKRTGRDALVVGVETYQRMPPLQNVCAEARAIGAALNSQPMLNDKASKAAVKQAAQGKAYIHFSCHGAYAWGGSPLASALFLDQDEPLTLAEVIGELHLEEARVVALSACETGMTDISQSPDEYIGLPAGFMQAGAPAVVSSLWTVDDRSTSLLMQRFYDNHLGGMVLAAALREAQRWLRDLGSEDNRGAQAEAGTEEIACPYAHPFYWAAFTYSGF